MTQIQILKLMRKRGKPMAEREIKKRLKENGIPKKMKSLYTFGFVSRLYDKNNGEVIWSLKKKVSSSRN